MCYVQISESQFAGDITLYARTREVLEQSAGEFVKTAAEWNHTVSLEKTKILAMGRNLTTEDSLPVQLKQGEIVTVGEFTYLGSTITRDGEVHGEVVAGLGKSSRAFGYLSSAVLQSHKLSVATKRELWFSPPCSMRLRPGQ